MRLQLGPSASRPVSAYRPAHDAAVTSLPQHNEHFNDNSSPTLTPVMGTGGRPRPLTPITMGLVKHILKTSGGTFGTGDKEAVGSSVHSLVQKKTQLLHDEEAMLDQYISKNVSSKEDSALQALAKARVKEISKQLRVLATWSRKHSSQQLTVPGEISFSRPSSAYQSIVSHVSALPQHEPQNVLRMGTPAGVFGNLADSVDAMALESNLQVQHSWPAVAAVVMTPWGAALSPLPPLALSQKTQQQHPAQKEHLLQPQNESGDSRSARHKDAETILIQQKQLEKQQQMLEELFVLQQKNLQDFSKRDGEFFHRSQQHAHQQKLESFESAKSEQPKENLILEKVYQLEVNARNLQHSTCEATSTKVSASRASAHQSRTRNVRGAAAQSTSAAKIAPTRDSNQGVNVGNKIYRDERGMMRNGGPQVLLNWDAAVAICSHLDAVPHLVRLSQTCVFFKRVCQLTPSLWHTLDLTLVGSFDVIMRSSFETRMTTADVSTLLTNRFTDGDMLSFKASSVQSVTDDLMPVLAKKCHNLLEMDVGWHNDTGPAVTDAGIILVLKHAQQLQVFKAPWVAPLTDATLLALSKFCLQVTNIDVSGVPGVSDIGITSVCESSIGPNITVVSLYGCERLTDSSLMRLARRCSSLVDVNVGGCSRMSGDAVVLLCCSCRHLEHLNVSGLFRLNDLHVFLASRSLLQLRTLSLSFCRNVGAEAISALTTNHPPRTLEPHLIRDRGNEVCAILFSAPLFGLFKMSYFELVAENCCNSIFLSAGVVHYDQETRLYLAW